MSYSSRFSQSGVNLGGSWSPAVRALIIANIGVYLLQIIGERIRLPLDLWLGLVPAALNHGEVWRLGTYMFLHNPAVGQGGLFHILFNMLMLWMFGTALESTWGTRAFLRYYFTCGIGAGLAHWILNLHSATPLIGASGAVFGLLLAFGMLFPDAIIYMYFFFPVKAKYLVMILAGVEFLTSFSSTPDGVGHFAHLGGLLVGFIYLRGGDRMAWWVRRFSGRVSGRRDSRIVDIRQKRRSRNQEEIDAILDKISADGFDSLSAVEKRRLRDAGGHVGNRGPDGPH